MPQHLDLDCPACGVRFVLDSAFAGSICRCSSCGALVSVQVDLPATENDDAPRHDDPRQSMTAADIHPTVLAEQRAMAGRSVMAYQRDIPPSRIVKHLGMLLFVGLIMAVVAGGAAYVIREHDTTLSPADPVQRTDAQATGNGSDLASHAPMFWGVTLDSPTVVLIDATQDSESWLTQAKQEVRQVHDVLQETKVPVTFMFFNASSIAIPRFESCEPLPDAFDAITSEGNLLPADALSRLGALDPVRIVLVSSQALSGNQVQAIDRVLDARVRLDVIWLSRLPDGLDAVVEQRKGVSVSR